MSTDFTKLPENLPIPKNDGAAKHLSGKQIPEVALPSTKDGDFFDFTDIKQKYAILYFFPRMIMPGTDPPPGWNDMPGARGCTPQNISFSENSKMFEKFDAILIGISSQPIRDLRQLSSMRRISQVLVSDKKLEFQKKIKVPTFELQSTTMYKRLTLIVKDSTIIKAFYPVFPPDKHVFEVIEWLENNHFSKFSKKAAKTAEKTQIEQSK